MMDIKKVGIVSLIIISIVLVISIYFFQIPDSQVSPFVGKFYLDNMELDNQSFEIREDGTVSYFSGSTEHTGVWFNINDEEIGCEIFFNTYKLTESGQKILIDSESVRCTFTLWNQDLMMHNVEGSSNYDHSVWIKER